MKLKGIVTCVVLVFLSIPRESLCIPAKDVIFTDMNNTRRDLDDILNQILPTNRNADLTNLTVGSAELNVLSGISTSLSSAELNVLDVVSTSLTASELSILDGISANVTAANLNELTGGGATTLHSHTGGG